LPEGRIVPKTYSTYEAKAKFSAVLRQVRAGNVVVISLRGVPVAEMHPIAHLEEGLAGRLSRLRGEGLLSRHLAGPKALREVSRKAGALKRFLTDRD